MGVTESAARKLIAKAESTIYPAIFKVLKELRLNADCDVEDIDFEKEFILQILLKPQGVRILTPLVVI
jgi:hypothetical protein